MTRNTLSILHLFLTCILVLLFLPGCADDLRNRNLFVDAEGDAVITFSVEGVSLTRSEETEDKESVIDHAYLLFYSKGSSLESDAPIAAVRAEIKAGNFGSLQFKMPLNLEPNTDYQILTIANADCYLPSGFNSYREYLEAWSRNTSQSDYDPLHLYSSNGISLETKGCLPMSGSLSGNSLFRFTVDNGVYNVSASLVFRRLVARIDVANIVKDGFEVEGIALCNWRDAVAIQSIMNEYGNAFGTIHGVLSGENQALGNVVFIPMPNRSESGIQQMEKQIYCFPSMSYKSSIGDKESPAIIIKAKYEGDAESTYYRVNVGMNGNVSKVEPNKKYLVTIQNVSGRGASTPEEAYTATESSIVLSVVEDWDLDGDNFDMDDKGNFIVLSRSSIDFKGDVLDNEMVKVLTSKGLSWTAEYVADNDVSATAFNVAKISDSAVSIGPNGENDNEETLAGKCRVSATTADGTTLKVDIALRQAVSEEKPYDPVIPADQPFAIIPFDGERVKVDHNEKTIEIDGFDPNCFNSFIDIPFQVYINESKTTATQISISSTLEWPLEGRISEDASSDYLYCSSSFDTNGLGKVTSEKGDLINYSSLYKSVITIQNNKSFYISVGAMGPDDPAIERKVSLSVNGNSVEYSIKIKPCQTVIDDVVLINDDGTNWLIQDRNIQDFKKFNDYVGYDAKGNKYQAYNYTYLTVKVGNAYQSIRIPFKNDQNGAVIIETMHELYQGIQYSVNNNSDLSSDNDNVVSRSSWLKKYCYSDNMDRTSPFYEVDNISDWVFPSESVIQLWASKLKVSKMRMFLISDVPAKNRKNQIPICCYLPYYTVELGSHNSSDTNGYYSSSNGNNPDSIILIYFDKKNGTTYKPVQNKFIGYSRLVRPLTADELEAYKQNYLGYGSQPHKLTICHPDTYGSDGWLSY